jgi:trehalose 6-phosphate phosphatase
MSGIAVSSSPDREVEQSRILGFFDHLRECGRGTLLLDYDGTLAPFTEDREKARPYVQVPYLLDDIMRTTNSRVIIVSGRPANSVANLLGTSRAPEIWGSHGLERIHSSGTVENTPLLPQDLQALLQAAAALAAAGLGDLTELKCGSVAVHWRGLLSSAQSNVQRQAARVMASVAEHSSLSMVAFEAGLELRVAAANKGIAVRRALEESDASCAAYVGDDFTDEDAFRAMNELGGLTVLMRPEYRQTAAAAWFHTPAQLFVFLAQWLTTCRGEQL